MKKYKPPILTEDRGAKLEIADDVLEDIDNFFKKRWKIKRKHYQHYKVAREIHAMFVNGECFYECHIKDTNHTRVKLKRRKYGK